MFNRTSADMASGKIDDRSFDSTESRESSVLPIDRKQRLKLCEIVPETTKPGSNPDDESDVLRMAFIQLMTLKVIEATANRTEVLKNLNSNIRKESD